LRRQGASPASISCCDLEALFVQFPNDLGDGVDVTKYHGIREQVIVIVHLVLLMAQVFLNPPVVAKEYPCEEIAAGFTFLQVAA
jgi:hypothetical protein